MGPVLVALVFVAASWLVEKGCAAIATSVNYSAMVTISSSDGIWR